MTCERFRKIMIAYFGIGSDDSTPEEITDEMRCGCRWGYGGKWFSPENILQLMDYAEENDLFCDPDNEQEDTENLNRKEF